MNKSIRKFRLADGLLPSVKPLLQALQILARIQELEIVNIPLSELHILTIENYIVKHDLIRSLVLQNVNLTGENLTILVNALTYSESLR